MARPKCEERQKAYEIYKKKGGNITPKEIAKKLGIDSTKVSAWKYHDKWDEELARAPRKKGAQPGNSNAKGKGKGNRNAVIHGAYVKATQGDLSEAELSRLNEKEQSEVKAALYDELHEIDLKIGQLNTEIDKYLEDGANKKFYPDRIFHMMAPPSPKTVKDAKEAGVEIDYQQDPDGDEELRTTAKSITKSSAFQRVNILSDQLSKWHTKKQRVLDSIRACEQEEARMSLEKRKIQLMKMKLSGIVDIDDETGEIVDDINSSDDLFE